MIAPDQTDAVRRSLAEVLGRFSPGAVVDTDQQLIAGLRALEADLNRRRAELASTNARVGSIMCTLVAVGALDYSQRAELHGDGGALDAVAACVNMLTEEIESANATVSRRTRELYEKSEILQSILDGMADGVVVSDLDGKFLVFNPAAERLLGQQALDILPAEWPAAYAVHRPNGAESLPADEFPLMRVLRGESVDDAEILVIRPRPQSAVLLSVTGRPLRNSDGIFGGVVVFRDITDKRRADENLRRLAAIVELSNDAIVSFDVDGIVNSWNSGAERLYGYTAHEMVGCSMLMLIPPDRQGELQQIFAVMLEQRQLGHFETVRLARGGSIVRVSISASPLNDSSGRLKGVSTIARDISQFKRVEAELRAARETAEAATRAKSEFLANVSHEVRTPLTAILGFGELLLGARVTDSERLNYLMTIRRNGQHLLSVLDDVLDLSKIEAGKMKMEFIPASPAQILHEVTSLMRVRAIDKGLELKLEYSTPIPAEVVTDPTRLKQILLNLVSNAIKFTSVGNVRIRASCEDPKSAEPRLVIQVLDTGIGMTETELSGLFQPFAQADTSTTRRFGGTGLGLGICKPLALALGGEIIVDTAPGRGSCFALRLRLQPLADVEMISNVILSIPPKGHAPQVAASRRFSGRALLAEDGPDNQILIASILRHRGATVAIAANGEVAIELALAAAAAGKPFDLILMDMQMPKVDGYTATAHLRAKDYRGAIVALTANAIGGERDRCLKVGCDDYMTKPIEIGSFLNLVARYLPDANFGGGSPSGKHALHSTSADARLESQFAGDPEMADVLARFLERLRSHGVPELRAACTAMDRTLLKRLAHQLNGAGGGYGFPAISVAAGELEDAVRREAASPEVAKRAEILSQLCDRAVSSRVS